MTIPVAVTPATIAELRGKACGPIVYALLDEIERLWTRERGLLASNNAELERRLKFEDEANQAYCEVGLLRNECIRLRNGHQRLAAFIEEHCGGLGEQVLDGLEGEMEAVFPPDDPAASDGVTYVAMPTREWDNYRERMLDIGLTVLLTAAVHPGARP